MRLSWQWLVLSSDFTILDHIKRSHIKTNTALCFCQWPYYLAHSIRSLEHTSHKQWQQQWSLSSVITVPNGIIKPHKKLLAYQAYSLNNSKGIKDAALKTKSGQSHCHQFSCLVRLNCLHLTIQSTLRYQLMTYLTKRWACDHVLHKQKLVITSWHMLSQIIAFLIQNQNRGHQIIARKLMALLYLTIMWG